MTVTREQVEWLRTLIGAFEEQYEVEADEDPSATSEMLSECRALAAVLHFQTEPEPTPTVVVVTVPAGDDDEQIPF